MKTTVTYTLSRCVKCLRCIKACPTSALSMHDSRIHIDSDHCINCGQCIRACQNKGLTAKGSTLADLTNYDYTICLVPSALSSRCGGQAEVEDLFHAIKCLGFDEVVDLSVYEGTIHHELVKMAYQNGQKPLIASFCPVIIRLIWERYTPLIDQIAHLRYPSEAAARDLKAKRAGRGRVGVFNICECAAQLALAKYPYGSRNYEVDHALAAVDLLPAIRRHLHQGSLAVHLSNEGLRFVCAEREMAQKGELIADGFVKCSEILSLVEFNQLKKFRLFELYACENGCIGGNLLWGNSYAAQENARMLRSLTPDQDPLKLKREDLILDADIIEHKDNRNFQEKILFFQKTNQVLEQLPGLDCSACGMQTCRRMAEEIVKGRKTLKDCRIRGNTHAEEEKERAEQT